VTYARILIVTFGILALILLPLAAAYMRLTGEGDAPRCATFPRMRGTRARRHAVAVCRRAGTMPARSWACAAIARRIQRLKTPAAGVAPSVEGTGPGRLVPEPEGAPSPPPQDIRQPARKATDAGACPRCGEDHKEPHCADGREWGPLGDPPAGITKIAGHGGSPDQAAPHTSGLRLPTRLLTAAERHGAEARATKPWEYDTGEWPRIILGGP